MRSKAHTPLTAPLVLHRTRLDKWKNLVSIFDYHPSFFIFFLNCCTIINWKTRKRSNTLKGSQRMGGGRIFLKTFRPLSLIKTYRMSIISAGSISLDSTFNSRTLWLYFVLFFIRKKIIKKKNFIKMFCAIYWTRIEQQDRKPFMQPFHFVYSV
jgi:hypothetical protein